MMSLATIRSLSIEISAKAAENDLEPYMVWEDEIECFPPFPFPNIGDYRPKGWELEESLLVDKSGLGEPWERALTTEQFLERIRAGFGYAIIEEGPFQVVIGEFSRN